MFKLNGTILDEQKEILANLTGSNNASFEIQYHKPSSDGSSFEQWFQNHHKKAALHAMRKAMHRKHVRIKLLSVTLQNVIFRSTPCASLTARSRRGTTKSVKNSSSSGSSDGGDPDPDSVFSFVFSFHLCHLSFSFNSFANHSFTEVAA